MDNPKVFADFHNADVQGRLRLNCIGTMEDLARQKITLRDGQLLTLYSEDLEVDGVVRYSAEENLWVAIIDWNAIRQQKQLVTQTEDQTQWHRGLTKRCSCQGKPETLGFHVTRDETGYCYPVGDRTPRESHLTKG